MAVRVLQLFPAKIDTIAVVIVTPALIKNKQTLVHPWALPRLENANIYHVL
jgi:hypothetical protein